MGEQEREHSPPQSPKGGEDRPTFIPPFGGARGAFLQPPSKRGTDGGHRRPPTVRSHQRAAQRATLSVHHTAIATRARYPPLCPCRRLRLSAPAAARRPATGPKANDCLWPVVAHAFPLRGHGSSLQPCHRAPRSTVAPHQHQPYRGSAIQPLTPYPSPLASPARLHPLCWRRHREQTAEAVAAPSRGRPLLAHQPHGTGGRHFPKPTRLSGGRCRGHLAIAEQQAVEAQTDARCCRLSPPLAAPSFRGQRAAQRHLTEL